MGSLIPTVLPYRAINSLHGLLRARLANSILWDYQAPYILIGPSWVVIAIGA